ncbi:MAG: hypothetical protein AB1716_19200, partial [Planctomycetota bacterium]
MLPPGVGPGRTWEFYGLTGPRLRELGVETVWDFAAHAAMLGGVVGVIGEAYRALRAVERCWRRAKRLGIPVLYYIAPQTWAARAYRNRQIVRDVDRLACILPFEEEYFRGKGRKEGTEGRRDGGTEGLGETAWGRPNARAQDAHAARRFRAEYVGHPLFEALRRERAVFDTVEFLKARAAGRPVVALLPGSRRGVIEAMLPRQLEVVRRMRAAGQGVYAAISCVSQERREQMRRIVAGMAGRMGSLSEAGVARGERLEERAGGPVVGALGSEGPVVGALGSEGPVAG